MGSGFQNGFSKCMKTRNKGYIPLHQKPSDMERIMNKMKLIKIFI